MELIYVSFRKDEALVRVALQEDIISTLVSFIALKIKNNIYNQAMFYALNCIAIALSYADDIAELKSQIRTIIEHHDFYQILKETTACSSTELAELALHIRQ